jgi:hypothetical protein
MSDKKSKKSGKKHKKVKKVAKKKRDTAGYPELVAMVQEKAGGDEVTLVPYPANLEGINEDCVIGVYKLRRVVNVKVTRKIIRTPKE